MPAVPSLVDESGSGGASRPLERNVGTLGDFVEMQRQLQAWLGDLPPHLPNENTGLRTKNMSTFSSFVAFFAGMSTDTVLLV